MNNQYKNYRYLYLASKLNEIIFWDLIAESYFVSDVFHYTIKKIEVLS